MSEITPLEVETIFDDDLLLLKWAWKPIDLSNNNNPHQNKNNQNKNKFNTNLKPMSDNHNNNNHNNHGDNNKPKKWFDYITYWLYFMIFLNVVLVYYIISKPSLENQALILYNENKNTYTQMQNLKNILNWKIK